MPNTLVRTTAVALALAALAVLATSLSAFAGSLPAHEGRAQSTAAPQQDDPPRPAGWSEASHSNNVAPNYDAVFPVAAVNTITITIAPDDWAAMQADMEEIYGPEREQAAALDAMSDAERLAYLQELAADAGGSAAAFRSRSPMWVPATIAFGSQEWQHVGVRYKGASSLTPWLTGEMKLPFKFDFDQFEDDYPAIDNQRFFGFKELALANNYQDPAGMRDSLVYELLAEAGLPSLRTAPYEIFLGYGEGPVRLGLYTMVEVIDDTGVPSNFGDDAGNLYEADGGGVSLAAQGAEQIEDGFEKKNNEEREDWSDIWALYDALHSEQRTGDPAAWRADLEAVFDVHGFLEWLGVAALVGHGDTYGAGPHNFYLYNNPATGQLTWFSWDHNLTFREDTRSLLSLDKANVSDAWPLIRFLLDDPVYWERYVELMAENYATVLAPEAVNERIRAHAEVIAPAATLDMRAEEYAAAVQALEDFVTARAAEAEEFLARETAMAPQAAEQERPATWSEASHGNDAAPNYDVVFPVAAVNTLTITIAPEDWAAMEADMADIYAPSLFIREGILAAGPDLSRAEREQLMLKLMAQRAAERAAEQAASAPITMTEPVTEPITAAVAEPAPHEQIVTNRSPMWIPATVAFEGQEWQHVGVRYKGASSLSAWLLGDMHLPFKFDFDQFEDDYPEIDNQRFFGFKQLSLANNHEDPAGMRDSLVYEILANAGLPSLRTAPYEIMLDYGAGPVRLGLYTMVEVIDDTGVSNNFGDDDGNIYEGEGWGAALAPRDMHLIEDSFQKKNNEDKEDWSDIWALYDVLNSEQRTSDPAAWRADLEAVFDVDGFLSWLGIAAVVGHADTYGNAYHNFYLYHNPATGQLTWFSWDHNMSFRDDLMSMISLDKAGVSDAWPLIRYLLDDPVYGERYIDLMAENFAGALAPEAVIAGIRARAEVLAPAAAQDMRAEEYAAAVQEVVDFVEARAVEIEAFLASRE